MKNKETLYMFMAFMGNAIFGFSFLFSKIAMGEAQPLVLLAVRFAVAFALMSVLIALGIVKTDLKHKDLKPLLYMGLMQPVLYFICESYGINMSSSSFAGIIISLVPIAGLIMASILLKEAPSFRQIVFSIVSVIGVIVLTVSGRIGGFNVWGLILLLGAVFSGAMFNIMSRRIANDYSAFERTYVMFGVGVIFFVPMAIVKIGFNVNEWINPLTNGSFWLSIIYLSCVSSIGAFMLLNKALDVLPATRSLVFANVTSVISVLAGVLILHESIGIIQILGIILVLIGVYEVNKTTD